MTTNHLFAIFRIFLVKHFVEKMQAGYLFKLGTYQRTHGANERWCSRKQHNLCALISVFFVGGSTLFRGVTVGDGGQDPLCSSIVLIVSPCNTEINRWLSKWSGRFCFIW